MDKENKKNKQLNEIISQIKKDLELYNEQTGILMNEYNKIKYPIDTQDYYRHNEAIQNHKRIISEIEIYLKQFLKEIENTIEKKESKEQNKNIQP